MNLTKIEWTDYSWNPITGCNKGCSYCYAKKMANRLKGRAGYDRDDPFKPTFHSDKLEQPKAKIKPSMIFTCSMGDFFDPEVEDDWRENVYEVMDKTCWHAYQVLTKQPISEPEFRPAFPKNMWLGITIDGTSNYWEKPLDTLRKSSAAMKFISFEPILGDSFPEDLSGIDWVIIGAQTGPGAKEVNQQAVEKLVDLIMSNNIPLFVKPNIRLQIKQSSDSDWLLREDFPKSVYKSAEIC